jgi:3-carboxy-cis,cis-muconate cycloisomerase
MSMRWLDAIFTTPELAAVFSDGGRLQGMLDFEAALARAQAGLGLVPDSAADAIASACRADLYDLSALAAASALAGNPAIPTIAALRGRVGAASAPFVHLGATSQDAMDTGLVLQLRAGLLLLDADLALAIAALRTLATRHRSTIMAGRTWLQHAEPTTFGLKVAGWLDALERDRERLVAWRGRGLVVQLGGAVGTLSSLGPRGLEVAAGLAKALGLDCPRLPWHAARDRVAELGCTLGLLVGTLGKMARDVGLLASTEVAEVFEPDAPGRGGSSSMPQKRNPIGAAAVLAAAARAPALVSVLLGAMTQAHERGLGDWPAEWETIPELFLIAGGAVAHVARLAEGLIVDTERMRQNLDATSGQIFAGRMAAVLAAAGAPSAHAIVEAACRRAASEKRHLRDVLGDDAEVRRYLPDLEKALERLFDPREAVGLAETLVDRVVR